LTGDFPEPSIHDLQHNHRGHFVRMNRARLVRMIGLSMCVSWSGGLDLPLKREVTACALRALASGTAVRLIRCVVIRPEVDRKG